MWMNKCAQVKSVHLFSTACPENPRLPCLTTALTKAHHTTASSVFATQTNPQAAALACLQFGCVSHGGACSCATHFVFRVMLLLLFKAKGKSGAHVSTSSLFPPGRCSVITYRAHIHLKRLSLMFACLLIFFKTPSSWLPETTR